MGDDQKNAMTAVILSAIVLFTWQSFFAEKVEVKKPVKKEVLKEVNDISQSTNTNTLSPKQATSPVTKEYKITTLSGNNSVVDIGNNLSVSTFKNPKSLYEFKEVIGGEQGFKVQVLDRNGYRDIFFNLENLPNSNLVTGYNSEFDVKLSMSLISSSKLNIKLLSNNPLKYRIVFNSTELELENRQIRNYIYFSNDVERFAVGEDENFGAKIKWSGIDFNHHLIAFVTPEKQDYRVRLTKGSMFLEATSATNLFNGDLVYTKKNYDDLIKLGDKLELSVDFGIFGILAVPILRGLQFFYKYVENYGLAIIFLTLIIRFLTFPLQLKSIKSMKKMQKVQPELNKIKEKYKDDQEKIRKETMELFKKSGANPVGGCLPMLLQMPFFFAFYQVLYNAVELVGAPFGMWIMDLSLKDPYYVLPILMGVSFFFQTHLNPTPTADPTQKKIMYIMPLVFCFIMKDLPAGLNLYMIISTIFGIVQQLVVFRMTDEA